MALKKHSAGELGEIVAAIQEAADNVQFAIDGMVRDDMVFLWTNSTDAVKRLIPGVRKFARNVKSDFETELDAFKAGKPSPAEMNQLRGLVNKQRKSKDRESMPKDLDSVMVEMPKIGLPAEKPKKPSKAKGK